VYERARVIRRCEMVFDRPVYVASRLSERRYMLLMKSFRCDCSWLPGSLLVDVPVHSIYAPDIATLYSHRYSLRRRNMVTAAICDGRFRWRVLEQACPTLRTSQWRIERKRCRHIYESSYLQPPPLTWPGYFWLGHQTVRMCPDR